MKKLQMYGIFAVVLALSLAASACRTSQQSAPPSKSTAPVSTGTPAGDTSPSEALSPSPSEVPVPSEAPSLVPSPSESPSAEPSSEASISSASTFLFKYKTYESGPISIKYPQITGFSDQALQDKLNKIIEDSALRDLPTIENDATLTDYMIDSTVTFDSTKVISMYFAGYANYEGTAHPYQFLYSVTIDVDKLLPVSLPQLLYISGDLREVLINGEYSSMGYDMTDDIESSIRDYLSEFDNEFWLDALSKADTSGSSTVSYLTPEALAVSVSAPHVMGDHIEILLKFNDLHGFQTDNPLWQEIEK